MAPRENPVMNSPVRVVAIIQARMGSNRLPGKVLLELAGEPMITRVVNRVNRAKTFAEVVIATTTEPADDALSAVCSAKKWACFRGSQDDVLDRYYLAALAHGADVVVRITSDCPLIEPEIIDQVVRQLISQPAVDYACNLLPHRTFPRGLDVEAFWMRTLANLWAKDENPSWREHVTQYLHQNPDEFRICGLTQECDLSAMRWTVDTREDLALIRQIYEAFGHDNFSMREVVSLLEQHPHWSDLNGHIQQKAIY